MDFGHYTYLLINIGTILFPLAFSFDKRVAFYKKWPYVLPAIFMTAAIFIPWDIWKTSMNVWHFNPAYVLGIWLFNLPLEEWLFFVTVPYAILFIYECLKYYTKDYFANKRRSISKVVFIILIIFSVFGSDKLYPMITFPFTAAFLFIHHYWLGDKYAGRFWMAYLVHLIPFFLVNGILTALPVVIYNPAEQFGIRIGTIPMEDTVYSMLLLLMNVTFFEWLANRSKKPERL